MEPPARLLYLEGGEGVIPDDEHPAADLVDGETPRTAGIPDRRLRAALQARGVGDGKEIGGEDRHGRLSWWSRKVHPFQIQEKGVDCGTQQCRGPMEYMLPDHPSSGDGSAPVEDGTVSARTEPIRMLRGTAHATVQPAHLGPPDERLWEHFTGTYVRDGRLDQAAVNARFDFFDRAIPEEQRTLEVLRERARHLSDRLHGTAGTNGTGADERLKQELVQVIGQRSETLGYLQELAHERAQLRAFLRAHAPSNAATDVDSLLPSWVAIEEATPLASPTTPGGGYEAWIRIHPTEAQRETFLAAWYLFTYSQRRLLGERGGLTYGGLWNAIAELRGIKDRSSIREQAEKAGIWESSRDIRATEEDIQRLAEEIGLEVLERAVRGKGWMKE